MKRDLPPEAPAELSALLDVHLMLLHDETLTGATKQWIRERHYNAEWALSAQLEVLARQFDEMEDEYLRERKADLEQVVERLLGVLASGGDGASPLAARTRAPRRRRRRSAGAGGQRHLAGRHAAVQGRASSSASSPTSAARPRTPRSSPAAWTSRRWSARARRAG